jgi:hypothetical protein
LGRSRTAVDAVFRFVRRTVLAFAVLSTLALSGLELAGAEQVEGVEDHGERRRRPSPR